MVELIEKLLESPCTTNCRFNDSKFAIPKCKLTINIMLKVESGYIKKVRWG